MPSMLPTIRVEFYGIPRARAGVGETAVELSDETITLGGLLNLLAGRFPQWADECLDDGGLRKEYTASLDGERFVRQPETMLHAGDTLLILSADGGG